MAAAAAVAAVSGMVGVVWLHLPLSRMVVAVHFVVVVV